MPIISCAVSFAVIQNKGTQKLQTSENEPNFLVTAFTCVTGLAVYITGRGEKMLNLDSKGFRLFLPLPLDSTLLIVSRSVKNLLMSMIDGSELVCEIILGASTTTTPAAADNSC